MAGVKTTEEPFALPLTGAEPIRIVQSGSKRTTTQKIADLAGGLHAPVTLAYAASLTVDLALYPWTPLVLDLELAGDLALEFEGGFDGQIIRCRFLQDVYGGREWTPGSSIRFSDDLPVFDLSTDAGATDYIAFSWHEATSSSESNTADCMAHIRGLAGAEVVCPPITWSTTDKSPDAVLTNSNLTIGGSSNGAAARSTVSHATGKYYVEFHIDLQTNGVSLPILGLAAVTWDLTPLPTYDLGSGSSCFNWGLRPSGSLPTFDYNRAWYNGSQLANLAPHIITGDVVMMAADLDAGKVWWGRNGSFFASGDPAAGTGAQWSNLLGEELCIAAEVGIASQVTARFAAADWSYSPPTGFEEWEACPLDMTVGFNPFDSTLNGVNGHPAFKTQNKGIFSRENDSPMSRSTLGHRTTGKFYFEVTIVSIGAGSNRPCIGLYPSSGTLTQDAPSFSNTTGWGFSPKSPPTNGSYTMHGGGFTDYGGVVAFANGNRITIAADFDNGKIWWGYNGNWMAGGNPSAGTGAAYSDLNVYGSSIDVHVAVWGALGFELLGHFTAADLLYTPPTGFTAWDGT